MRQEPKGNCEKQWGGGNCCLKLLFCFISRFVVQDHFKITTNSQYVRKKIKVTLYFLKEFFAQWVSNVMWDGNQCRILTFFEIFWKFEIFFCKIGAHVCARRCAHNKIWKVWTFSSHWRKKKVNLDKTHIFNLKSFDLQRNRFFVSWTEIV